jgi:hypothetical protein
MAGVCSNVIVARSGRNSTDSVWTREVMRLNETMVEHFEYGDNGEFL